MLGLQKTSIKASDRGRLNQGVFGSYLNYDGRCGL